MYSELCKTCKSPLNYLKKSNRSLASWEELKQRIDKFQLDYNYGSDNFFFTPENFQYIFGENSNAVLSLLHRALNNAKPIHPFCKTCEGPVEELFTKTGESRGVFEAPGNPNFIPLIQKLTNVNFPLSQEILEDPATIRGCEYVGYTSSKELNQHPFFTEATLYALYGKDDARSILHIIRQLNEIGRI